jgi:hypothetical protein
LVLLPSKNPTAERMPKKQPVMQAPIKRLLMALPPWRAEAEEEEEEEEKDVLDFLFLSFS